MKFFFPRLCIGKSKATDCTLLMHSIFPVFVSDVMHRAGVCLYMGVKEKVTEKRASKFLPSGVIPVHSVILAKGCVVKKVFWATLELPLI